MANDVSYAKQSNKTIRTWRKRMLLPASSLGASFFAWQRRARNASDWRWTARDHGKGTDGGRSAVSPVVSFLCAHIERDVWVRGSVATAKRGKTPVCLCLIVLKRARDLRADYQVYQCKSEATSQFLLTIRRLPLYFEVKQFASLSSVSCWINSSPCLSSCISLGRSFSFSYTWPALSSIISLSLVISCWSLSDYVLRKQSNECQYKERRLWCQVKKQLFFPVRQHACFYDTVEQSEHPLTTLLQHCCEIL